ncbi:MAG TPA: HNH endonuclease [Thermoleophilaceae bacterium]|jgi:putative restriction endonuclease
MPAIDPDHDLRVAAHAKARELARRYTDLVPVAALREGFVFEGERISFGSFQRGIHRPRQMRGPAALALVTAPRVPGKRPVYDDEIDLENRAIVYHYRAGPIDQPDNRALRASFERQVPLIYFHGIAPGQYSVVQPVFITRDDASTRTVLLEVGLPVADMRGEGLVSTPDIREYALQEVRVRMHQHRFRREVLRAYRHRCTICALREPDLVQAAHIVGDVDVEGIAAVVNGLALCAIHHLAYDRNLMGIDPEGVVHIAPRLRRERDGPMLREGLQGFHGAAIILPRRAEDRPDPIRLERRFEVFESASAA